MGDLKNSVARLRTLLKTMRYPHAPGHANGYVVACIYVDQYGFDAEVADLLRILHFALLDYSRLVAAFVLEKGYDLYGKTDARFIDHSFRLMRDEFQYFPSLNVTQFLSNQFLERKVILVGDILDVVMKKHGEFARKRRLEQVAWTKPRELRSESIHVQNHVLPPPPPDIPVIDTWSLLDHLRRESNEKAREQRRVAAQCIEERPQHNAIHAQGETKTEQGSRQQRIALSRKQLSEYSHSSSRSSTDKEDKKSERQQRPHPQLSAPESIPTGCECDCAGVKAEVHEVLFTLSKQISDLTTAVLSRVSAIESRLSNVEEQLADLHLANSVPSPQNFSSFEDRYGTVSRTKAEVTPSRMQSSWPPDPDVFARI